MSQILYKVFYYTCFLLILITSLRSNIVIPVFKRKKLKLGEVKLATQSAQLVSGGTGIQASFTDLVRIKPGVLTLKVFMNRYSQGPHVFLLMGEFPLIPPSGLYTSKSKNLPLTLQSLLQISIFPLIQTWLSQVKVMKVSCHSALRSCLLISLSEKGMDFILEWKLVIMIRIKPKLIIQGVSIYLWFYQNALKNYSVKYTAYTGDKTW